MESFTQQCLHYLELLLHGHVALFDACVAAQFLNKDDFEDRFYFALMLLNSFQCITDWIIKWVEQNDSSKISGENRKIVFLMDEVHDLIDICRGLCLHRNTTSSHCFNSAIIDWSKEQKDKVPASGKSNCTDVFYQLHWIMLTSSMALSSAPFGFVMCSTEYRTWEAFEVDNSHFHVA